MKSPPPYAAAVRERPLMFKAEMVRAILDGTKTQTRRLVKPQPSDDGEWCSGRTGCVVAETIAEMVPRCPYGKPGERLWVRETVWRAEVAGQGIGNGFLIYADEWGPGELGAKEPKPKKLRTWAVRKRNRWGSCPAVHMPRWACRIVLELTDVRVERLQAISPQDAVDEGCFAGARFHKQAGMPFPVATYMHLWNEINGAGAWEANPWVWVLNFKRVPS